MKELQEAGDCVLGVVREQEAGGGVLLLGEERGQPGGEGGQQGLAGRDTAVTAVENEVREKRGEYGRLGGGRTKQDFHSLQGGVDVLVHQVLK